MIEEYNRVIWNYFFSVSISSHYSFKLKPDDIILQEVGSDIFEKFEKSTRWFLKLTPTCITNLNLISKR